MLITPGYIQKVENGTVLILAPIEHDYLIEKQNITECEIRFDDGRTISTEQRKKAYAIMNEIYSYTGHCLEDLKEYFKNDIMARTGCEYFSLSNCSISLAREYISTLINFCFEWDVPTRDTLLNQTEETGKYLYSCLYWRKCAVCNKKAEIHHCTGSKVGMGFNRNRVNNLGRSAIALCRKHHCEAHKEEQDFFNKYHIFGITLDEHLLKKLKL